MKRIRNHGSEIEIISLEDFTPDYLGYSDIVRFKNRYFRTWDAEQYSSGLKEISKTEFERLKKFKWGEGK